MQLFNEAFFDELRSHPDSNALKPGTTTTSITAMERQLGHQFPPSYKDLLSEINGGAFGYIRLFGMNRGDDFDFDENLKDLSSFIPPIELRVMIPFANDWGGGVFCFDTYHRSKDGEYPIWYWNHEYSEEPADAPFLWSKREYGFVSFILEQVRGEA